MEMILEVLFGIFGLLLQALFEILAQAVFELAAEIGLRSVIEPFRKPRPPNPILAGIGYVLFGAAAGALSLFIPKMLSVPLWLRILNLIITPIVCGYIMVKVGHIRERLGEKPIRIDTFFYGYLFALAMAVVRFIWR